MHPLGARFEFKLILGSIGMGIFTEITDYPKSVSGMRGVLKTRNIRTTNFCLALNFFYARSPFSKEI
jgi:hypothetical protein